MATYHTSRIKQNNRQFKLKYAKRALRTASPDRHLQVHTLCGASVWFESQLVGYAVKKWGSQCISLQGFNTTVDEWLTANSMRASLPPTIKDNIELYTSRLNHFVVRDDGGSDFVDYDTCKWFFAANAKATLALCNHTRTIALTVILKGRHAGEDMVIAPEGMTLADVSNPEKIGKWIEARTNMRCVDYMVYKNPQSASTMATIILEKIERVPKADKEEVRAMLKNGMSVEKIHEITKFPLRSLAAMKAWLHPSFNKLRANF